MIVITTLRATSIMNPISHPANILAMGSGGCHFGSYLKVGGLLTRFILAILMVVLPLFWPLEQ